MHRLELYQGGVPTKTPLQLEKALDRDLLPQLTTDGRSRACTLCACGPRLVELSPARGTQHVCIPASGDPGGLLVVGEAPGDEESRRGMPFCGKAGQYLRQQIARWWTGPVAYDYALRCFPGKGAKLAAKNMNKCRGYLTQTLREAQPTRILAVGSWALFAIFGRNVAPLTARGGYGYIEEDWVQGPIPVFQSIPPMMALRNRFVRSWFERDLQAALTSPPPPYGPWTQPVRVVENAQDAEDAACEFAEEAEWVSFDVETAGAMWTPAFKVISVAACGSHSESPWVWPVEALDDPACMAPLRRVLESKRIPKVGQNVKYDQLAMRAAFDMAVKPIVGDTRLLRKLIDPEANGKLGVMAELIGMGGLKEEAEEEMGHTVSTIKRRLKKLRPGDPLLSDREINPAADAAIRFGEDPENLKYWLMPRDTLHRYNARDAVATARLEHKLRADLAKDNPALTRTWQNVMLPAAQALVQLETWGVGASLDAVMAFDAYLEPREIKAKTLLDQYAPEVNWDSPKQVGELLFGKLGLPSVKLTDTGAESTDGDVLEQLAKKHPLPAALLEYRRVGKMRGTYARGMIPHIKPDGRIHPNIKLDGARSGRTSCTQPNLQNIPRAGDSPEGKMARDCFIAPEGFSLVELDYSQLELRVAAMLSKDKKMREIFLSGIDYHLRTAQMISRIAWNMAPELIDKESEERSLAKNVNFGILYGKTANTFAEEWGCSKAAAQAIIDAIFGNFPQLAAWCAERLKEAKVTGSVWTWWDGDLARRRPLFRVGDADDYARSVAEHGAVNSPIQGTASDYCVASLAACVDWLLGDNVPGVKLVLAVHDALLFEARNDMIEETVQTAASIMLSFPSADVPLEVDCKVGRSWGSMQKYPIKRAA